MKRRRQKSEVRRQKSEVRRQKSEDRRQKSEDRSQKTEVRRQKSEDRKIWLSVLCFLSSVLCIFTVTCFAQTFSSMELIKNAKEYDGKVVTYSGEVIGDVMVRGEFAWVNINDGDNAIGIWMGTALTKEINFTGTYKSHGDTLEINGIFHRACLEHGGDLDIHAQASRKVKSGEIINQKLNFKKVTLGLVLLGALLLIWILSLFRRK